jgi:pimeloyl-ACP methyl ester carboxylesterase
VSVVYPFTPLHRGGAGEPLVLLHGLADSWRTWQLVLPALERSYDVLAPTMPGHGGGPPIEGPVSVDLFVHFVERAMDEAGFATAHFAGNSLGGYLTLKLAEQGRARSVVALAPAGGWVPGDPTVDDTLDANIRAHEGAKASAAQAAAIVATPEGRQRALAGVVEDASQVPPELAAHLIVAAARCDAVYALVENARRTGWPLDPALIDCPVRVVWGTEDRLLPWPRAAERYRRDWLPHADCVERDGVGHAPQLEVPIVAAQLILGFP